MSTVTRGKKYSYPSIKINMCDREALEQVERVFKTRIYQDKQKTVTCPRHLFPPNGKGYWVISKSGKPAEELIARLEPLLTTEFKRKWKRKQQECRSKT